MAGRKPAPLAIGALIRHLGWPTRTGRHRGPEQREPQTRVPAGTPSAIILTRKLRPIRQDHQQRGMARQNATSSARGRSRPRAPEQSPAPVTAALTLVPGPDRSLSGRGPGARMMRRSWVIREVPARASPGARDGGDLAFPACMTTPTASLGGIRSGHKTASEYAGHRMSMCAGSALNSCNSGRLHAVAASCVPTPPCAP